MCWARHRGPKTPKKEQLTKTLIVRLFGFVVPNIRKVQAPLTTPLFYSPRTFGLLLTFLLHIPFARYQWLSDILMEATWQQCGSTFQQLIWVVPSESGGVWIGRRHCAYAYSPSCGTLFRGLQKFKCEKFHSPKIKYLNENSISLAFTSCNKICHW